MNVEGDESRRRLNYYSRTSPKKHKHPPRHPAHSPLLPLPLAPTHRPFPHPQRPPSPRTTRTPPPHSSFRLELLSASRSSASEQILIEDADDDEILIVDTGGQEQAQGDRIVSTLRVKKEEILISQQGEYAEERQKGLDIRIEDDYYQQNNKEDRQEDRDTPATVQSAGRAICSQQPCIKIQNQSQPQSQPQQQQQPQTMSRQFTFGHQLAQAQKAEIQILPLTIPEQDQQEDLSSPSRPDSPQVQQAHLQSNMEYHLPSSGRILPELNMVLLEQDFQEGFDYQSPKFHVPPSLPRRGSDKWITAEDYHLLASPPRKNAQKILIEEDPRPCSQKSSARTSLCLRPYGRSIALLSQVLSMVPAGLSNVYEKMHRKLVADQIQAEERQERQEGMMKILRLMLQAQSQGLPCEGVLLSDEKSRLQRRMQANRAIIHALLRRLITQR